MKEVWGDLPVGPPHWTLVLLEDEHGLKGEAGRRRGFCNIWSKKHSENLHFELSFLKSRCHHLTPQQPLPTTRFSEFFITNSSASRRNPFLLTPISTHSYPAALLVTWNTLGSTLCTGLATADWKL